MIARLPDCVFDLQGRRVRLRDVVRGLSEGPAARALVGVSLQACNVTRLDVCLYARGDVCLVARFVCLFVSLCVCLFVCSSVGLFVCLFVCLLVHLLLLLSKKVSSLVR